MRAEAGGAVGRDLRAFFELRPHFWSSFYQRAKLAMLRPRPTPPFATIEVTRRCNLACGFCMAAGRQGGAPHLPLADFRRLAAALGGIERLVLIGGEPLLHPELPGLLAAVQGAGARAEIYTNGVALGRGVDEIATAAVRLGQAGQGPGGPGILTVAVDHHHADALGATRVGALLDGLQRAAATGQVTVRYNATDERFGTRDYLSLSTVLTVLEGIHPRLARVFEEACAAGTAIERFDFNPVVRMGRAAATATPGAELLRGTDLLERPELAIGADDGGELRLYTLLNAIWLEPRLDSLCRARWRADEPDHALRDRLAAQVLAPALDLASDDARAAAVLAWLLGRGPLAPARSALRRLAADDPAFGPAARAAAAPGAAPRRRRAVAAALGARARWRRLAGWRSGDTAARSTAPLARYLAEGRGPAIGLNDHFRCDTLPLPLLAPLVVGHHRAAPVRLERLAAAVAAELARHGAACPVAVEELADRRWAARAPAAAATVDTGVSPLPAARERLLLRPRWIARPGAELALELVGLEWTPHAPDEATRAASWARVLDALAAALPAAERAATAAALDAHPEAAALPAASRARLARWRDGGEEPRPEVDPVRLFESLTYERNVDRVPWDDATLAALVDELGLPGWAPAAAAAVRARLAPAERP